MTLCAYVITNGTGTQLELVKGLSTQKPGAEHSDIGRTSPVRYPSHHFGKAELVPSDGSNQSVPDAPLRNQ